MSVKINYIQASRTDWNGNFPDGTNHPGDDKIIMACLQRIAAATELMASNYVRLQNELEMYKRWYKESEARRNTLEKKVSSYKGVITKLKKAGQIN